MGMKAGWALMGTGRWRRLRAVSVQEAELCACLGQELGDRQQRAGQVDEMSARSGGAQGALVVVLRLWGELAQLARLVQLWKMESQGARPVLQVEAEECLLRM